MLPWVLGAIGLFLLDRLLLRLEARGYLYYRKKKAQLPSVGTVLLNLNVVLEPGKQYVVEAKRQQPSEQREDGAPPGEGHGDDRFVIPPKS
jgi:hypothetical protein